MLIAGHETTATVLLIAMIELALNPKWQRQLQQDLDQMFGDRLPSSWDLNADAEKMSGGTVGATINEGRLSPSGRLKRNVLPGTFVLTFQQSFVSTLPQTLSLKAPGPMSLRLLKAVSESSRSREGRPSSLLPTVSIETQDIGGRVLRLRGKHTTLTTSSRKDGFRKAQRNCPRWEIQR